MDHGIPLFGVDDLTVCLSLKRPRGLRAGTASAV
jgi:hypothetical protein